MKLNKSVLLIVAAILLGLVGSVYAIEESTSPSGSGNYRGRTERLFKGESDNILFKNETQYNVDLTVKVRSGDSASMTEETQRITGPGTITFQPKGFVGKKGSSFKIAIEDKDGKIVSRKRQGWSKFSWDEGDSFNKSLNFQKVGKLKLDVKFIRGSKPSDSRIEMTLKSVKKLSSTKPQMGEFPAE